MEKALKTNLFPVIHLVENLTWSSVRLSIVFIYPFFGENMYVFLLQK